MADILRHVLGCTSLPTATSHTWRPWPGRPGDFNARLLFLIDGMRVNENIYDAGLPAASSLSTSI
jgi:iron complex outermembrane receptor protein